MIYLEIDQRREPLSENLLLAFERIADKQTLLNAS